MNSLNKRRVIITGAGSGIGEATALAFAKTGARLVLSDINKESLEKSVSECKSHSSHVVSIQADVSTIEGAHSIIDCCISHYDGVDVLVNIAGILTQAPILEITPSMWDQMLQIDLKSVFLTTQCALPYMKAQKWGRIINVSSQLAIKGGAELAHYSAAKAGVIAFSKSVAIEVAKENILVNCVAPGPIHTPLIEEITDNWKIERVTTWPIWYP